MSNPETTTHLTRVAVLAKRLKRTGPTLEQWVTKRNPDRPVHYIGRSRAFTEEEALWLTEESATRIRRHHKRSALYEETPPADSTEDATPAPAPQELEFDPCKREVTVLVDPKFTAVATLSGVTTEALIDRLMNAEVKRFVALMNGKLNHTTQEG